MCAKHQALLYGQEIGNCNPALFRRIVIYNKISRLAVTRNVIKTGDNHTVTSMELETNEFRYYLTTGSNRKIVIYDTWNLPNETKRSHFTQVACVGSKEKHKKYMHTSTVNFIQWYPHDTGMFVTSSLDGTIKIWDTNKLKPAETMYINHPIYNHHISTLATSHLLIAAATTSVIRLADIRSGSISHTMTGHVGNVLCVRWSPRNEFVLASGSVDNKVLLWDVRQAKSVLRTLDQHNTETGVKPATEGTAHSGSVNCVRFTCDGRYLLSYATDDRMRLWNCDTGENTLVNYGRIDNDLQQLPVHMALYDGGPLSSVAFVPAGRQIVLFDLYSGHFIRRLTEHLTPVRCCQLNPHTQELYSAAQNSDVLVWAPKSNDPDAVSHVTDDVRATTNGAPSDAIAALWNDDWSDSD